MKGLEAPKNLEEQIMEFKNYDDCKAREVMKAYYAQGMYRLKEKYREDFEKDMSLMPVIDIPSKEEIIDAVKKMKEPLVDQLNTESPAKALKKNIATTDVIIAAKDIVFCKRVLRVAMPDTLEVGTRKSGAPEAK